MLLDPDTKFITLRLMSDVTTTSTTYWDDILISSNYSSTCVDARHYVAQTSPFSHQCTDPNAPVDQVCVDGTKETE